MLFRRKSLLYKSVYDTFYEFVIERNEDKCISCRVCERQCSYGAHGYDPKTDKMTEDHSLCVNCHRCEALCPTDALKIENNPGNFKTNAIWGPYYIKNIYKQASTGGVLLTGMGNDKPYPIY